MVPSSSRSLAEKDLSFSNDSGKRERSGLGWWEKVDRSSAMIAGLDRRLGVVGVGDRA